MMVSGIDVSDKNGRIDWSLIRNGDIDFAYIKATEALDIIDSQYTENVRGAQESGLIIGAYHWLHPGLHVGQQLENFVKTVKDFRGMLPPVVCLEIHISAMDEMERNIKAFLMLLERKTGQKPVIYTSDSFWMEYLPKSAWGCDFPLWIDKPGNVWPPQLWPWAGWTFWQYSYQAHFPGVPVNLGINWFNGSTDELRNMVIQ